MGGLHLLLSSDADGKCIIGQCIGQYSSYRVLGWCLLSMNEAVQYLGGDKHGKCSIMFSFHDSQPQLVFFISNSFKEKSGITNKYKQWKILKQEYRSWVTG